LLRAAATTPQEALYLVPLRIFIGLGWLRAGVEKVVDERWRSGDTLRGFIAVQLEEGLVLPFYRPLLEGPIEQSAAFVAAVVLVAQLVIGVAILVGWRTTPALLVGMVLNANFVLAGRTNPSVFYLLVEWALLVGCAGTLLGLDGSRRSQGQPASHAASPPRRLTNLVRSTRLWWPVVAAAAVLGALALTPFITTLSPSTVVDDPALVLITVLLLGAGSASLEALRAQARSVGL
jgi:thiosulfate dehydrogenase [quinone] large subunit